MSSAGRDGPRRGHRDCSGGGLLRAAEPRARPGQRPNVIRTAKLSAAMAGLREEIEARYDDRKSAPMQPLHDIDKSRRPRPAFSSPEQHRQEGSAASIVARAPDAPFVKVNCAPSRELIGERAFRPRADRSLALRRAAGFFERLTAGRSSSTRLAWICRPGQGPSRPPVRRGRVGSEYVITTARARSHEQRSRARGRPDAFARTSSFAERVSNRSPALRERSKTSVPGPRRSSPPQELRRAEADRRDRLKALDRSCGATCGS